MKGPFRLPLFSLLLLVLWTDYADSFTTKQKQHERKRHAAPPAAFDRSRGAVAAGVTKEAEVTTGTPGIQQQQPPPPVPFGIAVNHGASAAAATAVAYQGQYRYHEQEDEDDEEMIGVATAIVSCVLSLALGFGLGYGT